MFNLIKRNFTKDTAPVAAEFELPRHKGFTATMRVGGLTMHKTFPTLYAAQVWIMQRREFAQTMANAIGKTTPAGRAYTIRNLETGKFAPYKWQLTRADLV